MYTTKNFLNKNAIKEAIKAGEKVTVYEPGIGAGSEPKNGTVTLEGPHFPKPHTWYGQGVLKDGVLVSIHAYPVDTPKAGATLRGRKRPGDVASVPDPGTELKGAPNMTEHTTYMVDTGDEHSERPRLSESLARALRVCREGKNACLQKSGMTFAIMCGMLLERGLVREVKHRDHTRTYVPTETGLAALARSEGK